MNDSPWGFVDPQLKQSWDQFLSDPKGQSALLSFAAQALQPPQFGQSPLGQIAESVAKGGEAIRGIDKQEQQQAESESKQALRSSQADAAEARANTATARTDLSSSRLALQQEQQDRLKSSGALSQRIRIQQMHQAESKAREKANEDARLYGRPEVPVEDFYTWLAKRPQLHAAYEGVGGMPQMGQGAETPAPQVDTTATPAATTQPGKVPPGADRTFNGGAVYRLNGKFFNTKDHSEYKP